MATGHKNDVITPSFFLNRKLDSGPVLSKTVVVNVGQAGNNLVLGSIKKKHAFYFSVFPPVRIDCGTV